MQHNVELFSVIFSNHGPNLRNLLAFNPGFMFNSRSAYDSHTQLTYVKFDFLKMYISNGLES